MNLALDHVGYIVPDLGRVAALLQALGFHLSARAEHTRTLPSGEVVSAGSAQHSLMLHEGYIEFMEIFDPSAGHMLAAAGHDRHGLHILALGTPDAYATHAQCAKAQLPVSAVMDWSRAVDEADLRGTACFRFFGVTDWVPQAPSYLCWVQHLTPELLRPHALLRHPNQALGLVAVCYQGDSDWPSTLCAAGAPPSVTCLAGPGRARAIELTLSFQSLDPISQAAQRCGIDLQHDGHAVLLDLRDLLGMRWRCVTTV